MNKVASLIEEVGASPPRQKHNKRLNAPNG